VRRGSGFGRSERPGRRWREFIRILLRSDVRVCVRGRIVLRLIAHRGLRLVLRSVRGVAVWSLVGIDLGHDFGGLFRHGVRSLGGIVGCDGVVDGRSLGVVRCGIRHILRKIVRLVVGSVLGVVNGRRIWHILGVVDGRRIRQFSGSLRRRIVGCFVRNVRKLWHLRLGERPGVLHAAGQDLRVGHGRRQLRRQPDGHVRRALRVRSRDLERRQLQVAVRRLT
jgi:hypothetical protein